jgi:hypothetical protein
MRCVIDKISSVTLRLRLDRNAVLGEEIPASAGAVVACRVLSAKTTYNTLEDVHGRAVRLHPGDVIAGALGHRDALHGYSGRVPKAVAPGDVLQLLNMGGVIGTGAVAAPGVGEPFRLEVLGSVLRFPHLGRRVGVPAMVQDAAHESRDLAALVAEGHAVPPIIALVGTSMDSGKTTAATALIARMCHRGLKVAAGKLTGVSARRDILGMADSGAEPVAVFTDFGVVTTNEENAAPTARKLVSHLAFEGHAAPDVIVLELGDGLLGTYGVHALLADAVLRDAITSVVVCASDPVGAWGAHRILDERYGLAARLISGPVTDTPAGIGYCTDRLGVPTWNALRDDAPPLELLVPDVRIGPPLELEPRRSATVPEPAELRR